MKACNARVSGSDATDGPLYRAVPLLCSTHSPSHAASLVAMDRRHREHRNAAAREPEHTSLDDGGECEAGAGAEA